MNTVWFQEKYFIWLLESFLKKRVSQKWQIKDSGNTMTPVIMLTQDSTVKQTLVS